MDVAFKVRAVLKRFHEDENGHINLPEEYKSEVTYGAQTKSLVTLLYGEGVQSAERIVEIIRAVTNDGMELSQGTIFNWLESFYCGASREEKIIEDHLLGPAADRDRRYNGNCQWSTDLRKYKANHLLFLRNFDVPFDNNMSERDLRKCKNRQKMAGGFRTTHGKQIFLFTSLGY